MRRRCSASHAPTRPLVGGGTGPEDCSSSSPELPHSFGQWSDRGCHRSSAGSARSPRCSHQSLDHSIGKQPDLAIAGFRSGSVGPATLTATCPQGLYVNYLVEHPAWPAELPSAPRNLFPYSKEAPTPSTARRTPGASSSGRCPHAQTARPRASHPAPPPQRPGQEGPTQPPTGNNPDTTDGQRIKTTLRRQTRTAMRSLRNSGVAWTPWTTPAHPGGARSPDICAYPVADGPLIWRVAAIGRRAVLGPVPFVGVGRVWWSSGVEPGEDGVGKAGERVDLRV